MTSDPIEPPVRFCVWMRYDDRWVILANGHTRWHADLIARPEHVVLPVGEQPVDA